MIKVACEIQIPNLEFFTPYMDYNFTLVHMIEQNKDYRDFYTKSSLYTIQDNSAFELDEVPSIERLIAAGIETNADEIVLPEVVDDAKASRNLALNSMNYIYNKYGDNPPFKLCAVPHGSTIDEFLDSFMFLSNKPNIHRVCIPFALDFIKRKNDTLTWQDSRESITQLIDDNNLYNPQKKYHLLGCSNPIEMKYQSRHPWIDTLDTSSPIQQAVLGVAYDPKHGVLNKKKKKVAFDYDLTEEEKGRALYNLGMLKSWCA